MPHLSKIPGNRPLSQLLVRDTACPQLRVGSTGESLFWSLPSHSSGCKIPTHSRLTKSRFLGQGPQGAENAKGRQGAEDPQGADDAQVGTLGQ